MKAQSNHKIIGLVGKVAVFLLMALVGVIMLLPFYWSLMTSFRDNSEIMRLPISLFPKKFTLFHWIHLFQDYPWGKYFFNSFFVTILGVFTNLFFGSMAAYSFSKIRFKARSMILKVFTASMMLPGIIMLIPQYLVVAKFPFVNCNNILGQGGTGFLNTYWGLILPGAVGVYGVLFMRQFFMTTPDEIGEAARVDGAGEIKIFASLYLRMVVPGLMTLGVFTFSAYWNSFLWPSLVLVSDQTKWVLPIALKNYQVLYTDNYGPLMAGSVFITIPVFIVFLFTQKYYITNITFAGIKE